MVNRLLWDTNVLSATRTPHRQMPSFRHWVAEIDVSICYVSSLTWMEIQVGVLKLRQTDPVQARLVDEWFQCAYEEFRHRTVEFDDAAASMTAPLWLMRSRGPIDTLIAGTALAYGMDLVTRNVSDFADIPGLAIINPWNEMARR